MSVRVIQVIVTDLLVRGSGKEDDPIRRVTQYWDMDGKLLFEYDPEKEGVSTGPNNRINVSSAGYM